MREPAALAARHKFLPARSPTGWALGLLALLYAPASRQAAAAPGWSHVATIEPAVIARLRQRGIGARIENYGADLSRFESDIRSSNLKGPARYPLVSVPAVAEVDWRSGGLQIRPRTFMVDYEGGTPVFLTREQRSRAIVKVSLKQMRLQHRTWRRWSIVLPSMLLTVLWHWRRSD